MAEKVKGTQHDPQIHCGRGEHVMTYIEQGAAEAGIAVHDLHLVPKPRQDQIVGLQSECWNCCSHGSAGSDQSEDEREVHAIGAAHKVVGALALGRQRPGHLILHVGSALYATCTCATLEHFPLHLPQNANWKEGNIHLHKDS